MASKQTILALASAAAAATAALVSAIAEESNVEAAPSTAPAGAAETEAPKKTRGKAPADKPAGKTLEELKEIISPLVKGAPGFPGAGAKIKAIIKELGADALANLPADKQDEFLAAIKPLQEELEAASI